MILLPILVVLGTYAIRKYNEYTQRGDASEIVVDEVVGQWITFALGIGIVKIIGHNPYLSELCDYCFVIAYLICFVAFRFFDVVKPGLVGWVDKNVKGAWGVMLDDIIAGVLAGAVSAIIFLVF
jgi:phosphatidylglycerophosphatase A